MGKTIAVITGSRADFGHLAPVMRAIAADPALTLRVVVCGQHLDPRFGNTWQAVAAEGFEIAAKVDFGLTDDSPRAVTEATGRGVTRMAETFATLKPDICVLLGDRYEIFAAATAAHLTPILIAHIYGGEVTEGAFDDAFRHAISKMATLHCVAAEPYAARLRQMGEDPAQIHTVGVLSLDGLIGLLDRKQLAADLGLDLSGRLFVVTYHPVTRAADGGVAGMKALVAALAAYSDAAVVYTGVNSDPGHAALQKSLAADVAAHPGRRKLFDSLGHRRYLSAVKAADAVIGNSSSGIDEAPALGTPTVNIGDRQKGRLRAASVIDCGETAAEITDAIEQVLAPVFRVTAAQVEPPYGRGGAAAKIVAVLKSADPSQLSRKRFHDIIGA